MNEPKLKRRRNAYKARAVKLKKELEELLSRSGEDSGIKHKCEQLKEQLKTIKEVSENISDILASDEEAASFMEETYKFTDDCEDLIVTVTNKNDKTTEQRKKEGECTVKGIKQPELPVFAGNAAKFEDWETVFDAFIGKTDMEPKLKMLYLKNSLAGEALKLVEGYRPSGYEKARDQLTDKYGGKTRRIRQELNEIRHFPNITDGDTMRLEQFADRVACLITSLKESGSGNDLSDVSAYYILVAEKLHHSYVKNYQRWLTTTGREDSFGVFAEWLSEEARCEKRAKEMTKTEEEPKPVRMRNGRRTYATSKIKPLEANQKQPDCFLCQSRHMLHDCAEFQGWDVPRRYGFCKTERICFRCLRGKHRGVTCRTFPGCNIDGCGGSHHTLLHARQQQQQQRASQRDQPAQWRNPIEVREFHPAQQQGRKQRG